jgi:integrase
MTRHNNDGLRKLCGCARRGWAKCPHPWHFSFTWNGEDFRFSLERSVKRIIRGADGRWHRDRATLGDRIDSKTAAETERDRLRAAIRDGSLLEGAALKPQRDTLTLSQLLDTYRKDYIAVQRPGTHDKDGEPKTNIKSQIALIERTELGRLDGTRLAFGHWLVTDIGSGTTDAFQRARLTRGTTAANRDLALLRAMFRWAIGKDHVDRTPFKKSGETVIKLSREHKRRRRLQPGEGERLLKACESHLRALVEAALETGCRRGELLSLQWHQIRLTPKAEIFLPAQKTKTKTDRTVPISTRLRAILEMRRNGPDGEELPPDAHVFGNACGSPCRASNGPGSA